jgi:uncharacterized protein YeeX (DUF496 family)
MFTVVRKGDDGSFDVEGAGKITTIKPDEIAVTHGGKIFVFSETVLKYIGLFGDVFEHCNKQDIIPIGSHVEAQTFEKVVEYIRLHNGEIPSTDKTRSEMTDTEKKFTDNMAHDELCKLFVAADYLQFTTLTHVCAKKIANLIRSTDVKQIPGLFFGITREITEADIENASKNPAWIDTSTCNDSK